MTEVEIFGGEAGNNDRRLWQSIARGMKGTCPHCGDGRLFASFAKTVERCDVCQEEIFHHRADDLPAYLNIFVVGHIVIAGFMIVERVTDWSAWVHLAIWVPITLIMAFGLLQPIKGGVVGLQWANRMHGFGGSEDHVADPDIDPSHHG